jgi:hypothetical protein
MRFLLILAAIFSLTSGALAAAGDITVVPDFTPRHTDPNFDLVDAVSKQYPRTLELLKAEFANDYAQFMSDLVAIKLEETDQTAAMLAAFEKLTTLRRKYADKLVFAPSVSQAKMLGSLAKFYDVVLKNEGSEVCGKFATDGSAVLVQMGLSGKYAQALDQQSFAYFDAVVQAIETPNYVGVAAGEDWSVVLGAMVKAGAPQSFVATIQRASAADPDLCPALGALFLTSGLLDTPEAARTRADFAKNLTGY